MRRVLIISPHFPPVNAPDHQRVRMMLPYLPEFGWEATVVAFEPESIEAPVDDDLVQTIPEFTVINRVAAWPYQWTRRLGFGGLMLRGYRALKARVNHLLKNQRFDLLFFSSTIFGTWKLGPYFQKRYSIPYVVDVQDPLVNDYYSNTGIKPP